MSTKTHTSRRTTLKVVTPDGRTFHLTAKGVKNGPRATDQVATYEELRGGPEGAALPKNIKRLIRKALAANGRRAELELTLLPRR